MKKFNQYTILFSAVMILFLFSGCKKYLKEDVYTEYEPSGFLKSEDGIQKVLTGAYGQLQVIDYGARDDVYSLSEFPTDEMLENGGGFEASASLFINFQWDATNGFFSSIWSRMYRAVRDANVLLDNIDKITSISANQLAQYKAEARFIRAAAYVHLYRYFGPVPLITTAAALNLSPKRPSNADFLNFVITELSNAATDLPVSQNLNGKATKGTALAVLCKFYLNTKQWQKSADIAQQIIALNKYSLFPAVERLFAVENKNNSEYIYVFPCIAKAGYSNNVMAHTFPPGYPIQTNWTKFGAQFRLYTSFVNTFDTANDRRYKMILTKYINTSGQLILLNQDASGNPLNNARSFKYVPDPTAQADAMGNDIPVIRYADILLSRAEALNELNGPVQEAIDLINEIRKRAGINLKLLSDFTTKDQLRDFILEERGREFFAEGHRREDLIRMGKYISNAVARGKNAKSYQVLYPIPQSEIDANPELKQNDGY